MYKKRKKSQKDLVKSIICRIFAAEISQRKVINKFLTIKAKLYDCTKI